jgi:hypothetical protein
MLNDSNMSDSRREKLAYQVLKGTLSAPTSAPKVETPHLTSELVKDLETISRTVSKSRSKARKPNFLEVSSSGVGIRPVSPMRLVQEEHARLRELRSYNGYTWAGNYLEEIPGGTAISSTTRIDDSITKDPTITSSTLKWKR